MHKRCNTDRDKIALITIRDNFLVSAIVSHTSMYSNNCKVSAISERHYIILQCGEMWHTRCGRCDVKQYYTLLCEVVYDLHCKMTSHTTCTALKSDVTNHLPLHCGVTSRATITAMLLQRWLSMWHRITVIILFQLVPALHVSPNFTTAICSDLWMK